MRDDVENDCIPAAGILRRTANRQVRRTDGSIQAFRDAGMVTPAEKHRGARKQQYC
jgi:hypothetical protein